MKKSDLSRKVLCTVLAASVFGVCGTVLAAEDYFIDTDKEITGTELNGKNVIVSGEFQQSGAKVTVNGEYNIEKLTVRGESDVTFNNSGNISGGIHMSSGDELSLTTNNASITGDVRIDGGVANFSGGSIISKDYYQESDNKYVQEYIRVNEGSGLIAKNVNITGNIMAEGTNAEGEGSFIEITGGSINEADWYVQGNDNDNTIVMEDGKPVVDGYTDIQAEMGGKVTINDAAVNSSLDAQGNGSLITVNNSNINTKDGIIAWNGGKVILNGNDNTVYKVDTDGTGYGYFMAAKLNGEEAGQIEITGGTLKADNLRYLVGLDGDNYAYLNEKYDAEHIGNFEIVEGGIVLKGTGVIETMADQIFENGVDVTNDATVLNSESGAVTNTAISYEGGTLKFNDAKYSLHYLNSAIESLKKYQEDSETKIFMAGKLVNENGEDNKVDVGNLGDLDNIDSSVDMDQVTVITDKNLIIGGIAGEDDSEITIENGFSANNLEMSGNANQVKIVGGKELTLGGSAGGDVVTGTDNVDITIGDAVGTGSFNIGNGGATSETKYKLNGSVTVNDGSNLTTKGQTTITGNVTLNGGNLDAASGALDLTGENSGITATGNSTITGTVNVGKLTADEVVDAMSSGVDTTVINIGNSDKAANVVVKEAELNGATVFLDPVWKGNDVISNASNMAVGNTTVDGNYVVGQNSVLSFGVDNIAEAQEVFAKTGLTWGEGDITAALYIAESVNVAGGAIVVDGDMKVAPTINGSGIFTAEKGSVTMIDGSKFNDTATAITGVTGTNVTIDSSAKLFIDNAKKGETYNVISGTDISTGANKVWSNGNIDFDNTLLVVDTDSTKVDAESNTFVVGAKYQKVDDAYGEGAVVIADIIDETLANHEGDAAYEFFNAAASENGSEAGAVAAFNSAANMGEMGGVNHAAYSVSNAMTDAVADHLSIATHGDQDKDIWAHYVHNKENIEGISLGGINADYDLQYNGIVVGSDLYKNGKATAGIALSYVDGDVTSSNIASNTKNEAEYYGASVYGRIDNGNSAVIGDITYMHGSNDISQNNSGYKLTADADTDVFSIGVKAEQKVEAGVGQFVPYAGLRYMHIGTGNYTNSIGMSYDVDEQNLWLLPVGVTYSCEAQKGDWTIRPVVEAGYVWVMGDRETNQTVSLNGTTSGFGFDTTDSGSFVSRFAVEAEKANVVYSLGYEYQKGDTVKANKWMANMTWSF